jgi:predicted solute-binding protein
VLDHPAALCAQLAREELDVALVSSFEYLRNPIYRIVDGISISSTGPVYSVFVAHRGDISEIEEIELDPASETSVNLLRCVLAESRLTPHLIAGSISALPDRRGRLLIGDQAIRFRQEHEHEFHFWDLGEQWNRIVDLPFVYALWLVRPEVPDPKTIGDCLRALRTENLARIDNLIAEENEFDPVFCERYYREQLRFNFGETEREGLKEFQNRCEKHGLLPKREIAFNLA